MTPLKTLAAAAAVAFGLMAVAESASARGRHGHGHHHGARFSLGIWGGPGYWGPGYWGPGYWGPGYGYGYGYGSRLLGSSGRCVCACARAARLGGKRSCACNAHAGAEFFNGSKRAAVVVLVRQFPRLLPLRE